MKKILLLFLFALNYVDMIAMEEPRRSVEYNIAFAVQEVSQTNSNVKEKIIKTFKSYGIDLAAEKIHNINAYTKLLQLGAVFLGASIGSNEFKRKQLKRFEHSSYQTFFTQYPRLRDALIDLSQMKEYPEEKKGKLG